MDPTEYSYTQHQVLQLQDLELHQSFMKRVKVLVSTFTELAHQLLEEEEKAEDHVKQQLEDIPEGVESPVASRTASLSARGWISFRSKRHLDRTAALADSLRKDILSYT